MRTRRSVALMIIAIGCLVSAAKAESRTFTDDTGRFTIEAELVEVKNGKAHLKKEADGTTVAVPITRLSEADRRYVRAFVQRAASGPANEASTPSNPSDPNQPQRKTGRATIERELAKPTDYDFVDVPLAEAIEHLSEKHGLWILIASRDLERIGISADARVTGRVKRMPLRTAIDQLLEPLKLCLVIRNDLPVVVSKENAARHMETRVYKVLRPVPDPDGLIMDITERISPATWEEVGGSGSIRPMSFGALIVAQTDDAHRQLAAAYPRLLNAIVPPEEEPVNRPARGRSTPSEALRQVTEFEFLEVPLRDVVDFLSETHRVTIAIDNKVLGDVGGLQDGSRCVTLRLSGVRLATALEHLLGGLDLRYVVVDDALLITTAEAAEKKTVPRTYKIGDLTRVGGADELIAAITATIAPETWMAVGGNGSVQAAPQRGELRITQSERIHRRIGRLLGDLRLARKR